MMANQQTTYITAPPGFEHCTPSMIRKQQASSISAPHGFETPIEKTLPQSMRPAIPVAAKHHTLSLHSKSFAPTPHRLPDNSTISSPFNYNFMHTISSSSLPIMYNGVLKPPLYVVDGDNYHTFIEPPETNFATLENKRSFPISSIRSHHQPPKVIDLNVACSLGNIEMVKCLINSTTINMKDGENWTPLAHATWKNSTDIIKLLLHNGADIHSKVSSGETSLHWAVMHNNTEICKELINRGANVNEIDRHSNTPLHFATSKHNIEIMQLLIAQNADVNARDKYGNTPLHRAAYKNDIRLSKILIDAGADIYALGRDGESLLQIASKRNHGALVSLIVERGLNYARKTAVAVQELDILAFNMCNSLLGE